MTTHIVSEEQAGDTLAKTVRGMLDELPWSKARALCEGGRVYVNGKPARDAARRLAPGETVEVREQAAPRAQSGLLPRDAIIYVDRDLVVVNKPAGLMSVPFERSDRDTLVDITRARLRRDSARGAAELGVVQRLDKDTSGVMLFARTLAAKRALQQQWRVHAIERVYWALCHGAPAAATHDTQLLRNRGDGLRGSYGHFRRPRGPVPRDARQAITHVRTLEPLGPASLVECRLDTGRQHQIRIHLSEAGHPLLGEEVYIRDFADPPLSAPRLMLHAHVLGLAHPRTGEPLRFVCEPPKDFDKCLSRLRRHAETQKPPRAEKGA